LRANLPGTSTKLVVSFFIQWPAIIVLVKRFNAQHGLKTLSMSEEICSSFARSQTTGIIVRQPDRRTGRMPHLSATQNWKRPHWFRLVQTTGSSRALVAGPFSLEAKAFGTIARLAQAAHSELAQVKAQYLFKSLRFTDASLWRKLFDAVRRLFFPQPSRILAAHLVCHFGHQTTTAHLN